MLDCLKRAKEDIEFDPKCRNIVIRRQIMESQGNISFITN